jgi:hypothetical protein
MGTLSYLKGQSHQIGVYFELWKIITVLSAGPLMVFKFFNFVVPKIFIYCFNTVSMKIFTTDTSFPESCWCSQAQFLQVEKDFESC